MAKPLYRLLEDTVPTGLPAARPARHTTAPSTISRATFFGTMLAAAGLSALVVAVVCAPSSPRARVALAAAPEPVEVKMPPSPPPAAPPAPAAPEGVVPIPADPP